MSLWSFSSSVEHSSGWPAEGWAVFPQVYLREAPWPSAQSEIRTISAYKTPRDKVQCILRMCSTIMNLLSLANEDSVPGADDFVPVLVFVLIKVRFFAEITKPT